MESNGSPTTPPVMNRSLGLACHALDLPALSAFRAQPSDRKTTRLACGLSCASQIPTVKKTAENQNPPPLKPLQRTLQTNEQGKCVPRVPCRWERQGPSYLALVVDVAVDGHLGLCLPAEEGVAQLAVVNVNLAHLWPDLHEDTRKRDVKPAAEENEMCQVNSPREKSKTGPGEEPPHGQAMGAPHGRTLFRILALRPSASSFSASASRISVIPRTECKNEKKSRRGKKSIERRRRKEA